MKNSALFLAAAACLLPGAALSQVGVSQFVNFESSQTNPVRLSPDGTRLFAVDTPDARVSVFNVAQPGNPVLIAEIPVGIEPVSVNPRTDDEVWVVNQESDSVSVVSVSKGIVTDTLQAKDEPMDVVFAGGLAFVSISRSNQINAYNVTTHALVASIPVFGGSPRALAVSKDGTKVYAAFAISGNATTIIPVPEAPPPPPPTNPKLPPAPAQGIIVQATDPSWSSFIQFNMPDNDVVEIDVASQTATRYFSGVGTINLGLAVSPVTGDLYVANTDALNLVRFEPNLRGHFIDSRITRVSIASGVVTPFDLNPNINYSQLPNPVALSTALSQPAGTVFDPSGNFMWLAAFGTDRVAKVDNSGNVLQRIEIGDTPGAKSDPTHKRGPRGLALNASAQTLYVLNRISNSLSVVNTASGTVTKEIAVGSYDPTPSDIKAGRGFLYDAKLSGNGTGACASCHVDGDMDHLAWDLGDPDGNMTSAKDPVTVVFHPMKGPMTTLALKGLDTLQPYHWRGDKANFAAFNSSFNQLLGGSELSDADMTTYQDFVFSILFQPNPNENLDRTLPTSLAGGNPQTGFNIFTTQPFTFDIVTCNLCHLYASQGTDRFIIPKSLLEQPQPFKTPQLRNIYQKLLFNNAPGASTIDGYGLLHDGSDAGTLEFLSDPVFGSFSNNVEIQTQLNSYMLCFDTGMAPTVGYTITMTAANVNSAGASGAWNILEGQAKLYNIDLIMKGTIQGQVHGLLYETKTNNYVTDTTGLGPFTHAQLVSFILSGDTLSPMGVPYGTGLRMGIDRNLDGVLDGDQAH
ncbi:MAG: beta-propeller fold lactonase family protein [Bryobacteraceae bacterium]